MARALALGIAIAAVAGIGGDADAQPASSAQVDSFYFRDPDVEVVTIGGEGKQELGGGFSVTFGILADRIVVSAPEEDEDEDEDEEEDEERRVVGVRAPVADAVTSASSTTVAAAGPEWRVAGGLGLRYRTDGARPLEVGVRGHGGVEDDYRSSAVIADAVVELRERTIALGGFVGGGYDRSLPLDDVAPESTSSRWFGGASVGVVATPRLVLNAGASLTVQSGQLASPYRTATVGAVEVPEVLPETRTRATGYLGCAWAVADATAIHARAGLYADTWNVRAVIPEVALARELGDAVLVALGYRFYRQSAASFHRDRYNRVEAYLSGDPRLAALSDHTTSVDVSYRWETPGAHALTLRGSYSLSALTRDRADTGLAIAHVLGFGVAGEY